ncbi:MAG: DNA-binding domain-containing protein [Boseongicola sp.]|nr:DNA-binding domain-containing protein [Boseongicola sp.]
MTVDQTTFREALLDPEAARPNGLRDGEGRPAGRRFDVYRNNVAVSLTEALEVGFPVIRKLVGQENFKLLASAYLRRHPPRSPLMMHFGADMPSFLADFEPTRKTGYLPDVARLELAIRESYHAADADSISAAELEALPPEALVRARVRLAPSLRLVRSSWPILSIWRFNVEEGAKSPEMAAENVLVARPDLDPVPRLLPSAGAEFVSALLTGATFGDAMDKASDASQDFELPVVLTLLVEMKTLIEIGG